MSVLSPTGDGSERRLVVTTDFSGQGCVDSTPYHDYALQFTLRKQKSNLLRQMTIKLVHNLA